MVTSPISALASGSSTAVPVDVESGVADSERQALLVEVQTKSGQAAACNRLVLLAYFIIFLLAVLLIYALATGRFGKI